MIGGMEARGGFEPPVGDLQSPALPLCYPATREDEYTMSFAQIK
jgi:hypothetical protein